MLFRPPVLLLKGSLGLKVLLEVPNGKKFIGILFFGERTALSFIEYPQTSHVGAYRIRPNASTYPRGCLRGVCDTPLQSIR